jgi:hypothetical protein
MALRINGGARLPWCGTRLALKLCLMGSLLRRRDKPRLRLTQSLGAFTLPEERDISPLYVFFDVANLGQNDAEVRRLYVGSSGHPQPVYEGPFEGERGLPCTLYPGETVRFWVRARALARALKEAGYSGRPRVRLVAEDGAGDGHKKAFRFRVDEYLALKDE